MTKPEATHSLLGSNVDKIDTFTARCFTTLLGKAGFYVTESRTSTTRTFALHKTAPTVTYTPYSDRSAHETEPHELGPVTRLLIHEADELETQRASEGMAYSDDETDHRPSNED